MNTRADMGPDSAPGGDCEYIVVGGGTAGCVAAWRLMTETGARVVLLETGADYTSPYLKLSPGYSRLVPKGGPLHTSPDRSPGARLQSRFSKLRRGRVLGGGSSVNAQVYMRGYQADYDQWGAVCRQQFVELGNHAAAFSPAREQPEVRRRISWLRRSADGRGSRILLRVQPPLRQGRANARPAVHRRLQRGCAGRYRLPPVYRSRAVDVAVSRRHFLAGCDRIPGSAS